MKVFVPHLVAMSVFLFTLLHFSFFTGLKNKALWAFALLSSAFIENVSGVLIRYINENFAYVKLISFVVFILSMLYISAIITIEGIKALKREISPFYSS